MAIASQALNSLSMKKILYSLTVFASLVTWGCFAQETRDTCRTNPANVSIVIMGRSGAGISSSLRQLLGPQVSTGQIGRPGSLITEYTISRPDDSGRFLKFVDVSGLVDGKTESQDADVLSALRSYIRSSEGLGGYYPNAFVIISNFDDSRFSGKKSVFTKVLSRVELFQKKLCGSSTNNTVILFTKLMRETLLNRKKPNRKIPDFRNALKDFTSFSEQLHFVVGENLATENGLSVENGYTILPNREEYPKNVFNKLIETFSDLNDQLGSEALAQFRDSRQWYTQIFEKHFRKEGNVDFYDFLLGIYRTGSDIKDSEINLELEKTFETFDLSAKNSAILSLVALQLYFQKNNLTNISQLPRNTPEKVKFFQNLEIDDNKLSLLSNSFSLKMPEYVDNPVVGRGFDVTKDEALMTSPFTDNTYVPSKLGYALPDYLACSLLPSEGKENYEFFSENLQEYIPLRMKYLDFDYGKNFSFTGQSKTGFNIRPSESENIVSLTAAQEVRVWKCEIEQNPELNQEFVDTVNTLTRFNESDRESVSIWQNFFGRYGTHVVSRAYGGGHRAALISISRNSELLETPEIIMQTLQKLNDFDTSTIPAYPLFSIFGGYRDPRLEDAYNLDSQLRDELLSTWKSSLKYEPIMSTYDLKLTPISKFAGRVNENIQQEVDRAIGLFFEGKLIFKQSRRNTFRNSTNRPKIIATTTVATIDTNPTTDTIIKRLQNNEQVQEAFTRFPTTESVPMTFTSTPPSPPIYANSPTFNFHSECTKDTVKYNDYTENVVGQSFHVLKDIILPSSPFDQKEIQIGKLIKLCPKNICTIVNLEEFDSVADYIIERISKFDFNLNFRTRHSKVPPEYTGKIRPGNIVKNIYSINQEFQFEVEHRIGTLQLIPGYRTQISSEFKRAVNDLRPLDTNSCNSKMQWRKFFDTYGTHYVESAPYGWSFVVTLSDTSLAQGKAILGSHYRTCTTSNMFMIDKIKKEKVAKALKFNMQLNTLGSTLSLYNVTKKMEVDKAYFVLLDGRLNCNN